MQGWDRMAKSKAEIANGYKVLNGDKVVFLSKDELEKVKVCTECFFCSEYMEDPYCMHEEAFLGVDVVTGSRRQMKCSEMRSRSYEYSGPCSLYGGYWAPSCQGCAHYCCTCGGSLLNVFNPVCGLHSGYSCKSARRDESLCGISGRDHTGKTGNMSELPKSRFDVGGGQEDDK